MEFNEYRFADCVLDAARRELARAGERRPLEPKAFDVLLHLVRHRQRVVRHEELLQALWQGEPGKAGALARVVLLVRRAIGDDRRGHLIQTISRVGYRFVGKVAVSATAHREGSPSLALLPFENHTDDSRLDWVELGMMSLVARALGEEPRLDIAPPAAVLAALDTLPSAASATDRAAALRRLLGVRQVVAVRLAGRTPALSLHARWVGDGTDTAGQPDALVASAAGALPDLAAGLARRIVEALLPAASPAAAADDLADPLAGEAMARALQAAAEQRWTAAVNLMQVVLDIAPDSETAQLEMLRAQAALGDPAARSLGHKLLAHAQGKGDRRLQASVEQALGRGALNQGAYATARGHLDRAIALAEGEQPSGWMIQTLLWQSSAALRQGAWADAEPPLQRARALSERSGNRIDALACLTNQALIEANQGNRQRSMALSREVMDRSRELKLHRYFVDAANNLAEDCAALGLLHEAADVAEEGFAAATSIADRYHLGVVCTTLGLVYFHLRRVDASARMLVRVAEVGFGSPVSGDQADLLWARAYHAAASGDAALAADLLQHALDALRERGEHLADAELMPWWLLFATRAGCLAEVGQRLADWAPSVDHFPVSGGLAYARAVWNHAGGQHAVALDGLAALVDQDHSPWSALARMDGAWLAIESGRLDQARAWLDGLGPWRHEHPVAQAVEARWLAAAGRHAEALQFQRRYEAMAPAAAPRSLAALGACYKDGIEGVPAAVPPAPWLPTIW